MDLIYTSRFREELGVLFGYELDLAFGADENDFECTVTAENHVCENGSLLFFEGTEYGGMVDAIESNTATDDVIYSGRTWHGMLNSKVLEPDAGESYLVLNGEANAVLASLVQRMGLTDLFSASAEDSGITISSYKMSRYILGYDGIMKMLGAFGAKLKIKFSDGVAVLSAHPVKDYTKDEEFDSDLVPFTAKRNYKSVNHLVCLGSGELSNRLVVHLYADDEGNISHTQTFTGIDEITSIYEYSQISEESELIAEGTAKFKELLASDEIVIDFDADSDEYDVGDIIGAVDNVTGLSAHATIKKKVLAVKNGQFTISLEPDTAKSGSTQESAGGSGGGGGSGESGATFTPSVDADGNLSWTNDKGLENPATVNIKGEKGDPGIQGEKGEKGDKGDTGDTLGVMPNLLDNWYFGNPVNQRGETNYSAAGYTIDRWKASAGEVTVAIGADSIAIAVSAGAWRNIGQAIEFPSLLNGKTVTLSVWAESSHNIMLSLKNETTNTKYEATLNPPNGVVSLTYDVADDFAQDSDTVRFFIFITQGTSEAASATLKAAKLELGDTQTLAHQDSNGNWVLNEIPNYAEQLAECQRYFLKVHSGDSGWDVANVTSGKYFVVKIPTPVTMRCEPSVVVNSEGQMAFHDTSSWKNVDPTKFSVYTKSGHVVLAASASTLGLTLTANTSHLVRYLPSLSADL